MALTYTGKLFRRIAIACGKSHKVWETHLVAEYRAEYESPIDGVFYRGEGGAWTCALYPVDSRSFEFWRALKWLEAHGYIARREGVMRYGTYGTLKSRGWYIELTDKGRQIAPRYMAQDE